MKKFFTLFLSLVLAGLCFSFVGCSNKETVTIYTSTEDYNMEYMQQKLDAEFPDYTIVIEYMSTSKIATKIIEEGESSDCDIVYAEEFGYLEKMAAQNVLADISSLYDMSVYMTDTQATVAKNYLLPTIRSGGAVIINNYVLQQNNLPKPTSYNDLLDVKYDNLVSMPSPKSSGTGYMFLLSLVNAWGEADALSYFDSLTPNVLAYTSSGSGPVNALVQREVAVGFGMVSQAVTKLNDGNTDLEILFFEEGAPFNLYGNSIVKGKESRESVKKVMDYLYSNYTDDSCSRYYPEPVLKEANYSVVNFPVNINYANMNENTLATKDALLDKWTH